MADTPWTKGPYLISGHVVYVLEEFRDRRGRYEQRNRITIQVDGGPDTPKEEVDAVKALLAAATDMAEALAALLREYVELWESGDCGNWDTEKDEVVINARAALAKAKGD